MSNELGRELATIKEQMGEMDITELRKTYNELYGTNINGGNKAFLRKKIWEFVDRIERKENRARRREAALRVAEEQQNEIETDQDNDQAEDENSIQEDEPTATGETNENPVQEDETEETNETEEAEPEEQNSEVDANVENTEQAPAPKKKTRARANDPRIPSAGTVLVRNYREKEYTVKILEDAFEYDGKNYSSLSKVAKEITRTSWNGYTFFGLNRSNR